MNIKEIFQEGIKDSKRRWALHKKCLPGQSAMMQASPGNQ